MNRCPLFIRAAGLLALAAVAWADPDAWNITDHIPLEPPADESPADNPFRLRNAFLVEVGHKLRAHRILFQTFPYTDDPSVYAKLLDLGVMSFATDHPDVTMREIKAYYAARKFARSRE